jgi:hypothetical protein
VQQRRQNDGDGLAEVDQPPDLRVAEEIIRIDRQRARA